MGVERSAAGIEPGRRGKDPARPFRPGWRKRRGQFPPMAAMAMALAAGIAADRIAEPWGSSFWSTLALALAGATMLTRRRWKGGWVMLLLAVTAIGGTWHHRQWSDREADDLSRSAVVVPTVAWLRGLILTGPEHRQGQLELERPNDQGFTRFAMRITARSDGDTWYPASGQAEVTVGGDRSDLEAGDAIELAGSLSLWDGPLNPGERDRSVYPRSQGIRMRLNVDDPEGVSIDPEGVPNWPVQMLGRLRLWSSKTLAANLGDRAAPLGEALLLGRRGEIDDGTSEAFARTGTAHVLAISGLHLAAMAALLWMGARVVGLGPRTSAALVMVTTLGYATLVGWTPSVSRAAVMVSSGCAAAVIGRQRSGTNALATAAVVSLAITPASLFAAGWQLSFLAAAVLILGVPPMGQVLRRAFRGQEDEDPLDALERSLEPSWSAGRGGSRWLR